MSTRRPGFTIPGNAAAAGRKAQELGHAHRWTPEEAREIGRRAGELRLASKREDDEPQETLQCL